MVRSAAPRIVARDGDLVVERDPRRPTGRLLRQADMEASYVDLADASHLEFDYMRWMRIVLRAARARRVLHIGGGACALARALAAEDPSGASWSASSTAAYWRWPASTWGCAARLDSGCATPRVVSSSSASPRAAGTRS